MRGEVPPRCPPLQPKTERDRDMKLTKAEIRQKQEDLVKVLLQLKRQGDAA